jgi:hypothetical protein
MAAPATTAIGTPAGLKLRTGWKCLFTFSVKPTVSIFIKSSTPPGLDGGDMIPNTTFLNTAYRTGAPRQLITVGPANFTAEYAPEVYSEAPTIINKEGSVSIWFPDGSHLDAYAYLRSLKPSGTDEGKDPELEGVIEFTNYDPVNHVEVGPVYTPATGTGVNP